MTLCGARERIRNRDIAPIDKSCQILVSEAHNLLKPLSWHQFGELPGEITHLWAQYVYEIENFEKLNGFAQKLIQFEIEDGSFEVAMKALRKLDKERARRKAKKQQKKK